MAECLETVGTVLPTCCFDINLDPDFVRSIEGTNEYRDMVRQKEEAVTTIAKKYGSPKGGIVL